MIIRELCISPFPDHGLQSRWIRTNHFIDLLLIDEHGDGWQRGDSIERRNRRCLIDVDLEEMEGGIVGGELIEEGSDHLARTTTAIENDILVHGNWKRRIHVKQFYSRDTTLGREE